MFEASAAAWWYWGPFLAAFGVVGFWETFAPLRSSPVSTPRRWAVNVVLLVLASVLQRVLLRASPAVVAVGASAAGWGLLPRLGLPVAAQWAVAMLALDCFRYAQHVAEHKVGVLWRLHQVHHADQHYDLSTGVRFHPVESFWSNAAYFAFVAALGVPVGAALVMEAGAGFQSIFAHANVELPARVDAVVRRFWITPNLHRVHHSVDASEQNSNFGMILAIWDWMFGTYRGESRLPAATMPIGVAGVGLERASSVWELLAMPFRRRV